MMVPKSFARAKALFAHATAAKSVRSKSRLQRDREREREREKEREDFRFHVSFFFFQLNFALSPGRRKQKCSSENKRKKLRNLLRNERRCRAAG